MSNSATLKVASIQGIIHYIKLYRLNVNNADYAQHKEKRDRALNYWKNRVVQDFLPPIDAV